MTERQYCQLLTNRQRAPSKLLFGSSAERRLLRWASRDLRRRERAGAALLDFLPGEWAGVVEVETLNEGTLVVSVSDPVVCELMRRRRPTLERELAGRIPHLRRLVVASGRQAGPRDAERGPRSGV